MNRHDRRALPKADPAAEKAARAGYIRAVEILGQDGLAQVCAPFAGQPNTPELRSNLVDAIDRAVLLELAKRGVEGALAAARGVTINPIVEGQAPIGHLIVQFHTASNRDGVDLQAEEASIIAEFEIDAAAAQDMFGAVYQIERDAMFVRDELLRRHPELDLRVVKNVIPTPTEDA